MLAFGLERGAEVILPSFTFSALLNVILQERLRPKFVDIAPSSYNPTVEGILAAITDETRAVIAVHTFGSPSISRCLRPQSETDARAPRAEFISSRMHPRP